MLPADYVIVLGLPAKPSSEAKSRWQQTSSEYSRLVDTLRKAGLHVTGRPGSPGSNQVLLLVRVSQARLEQEIEQERVRNCVHDVGSTPNLQGSRDFTQDPIQPAERLRNTYRIITYNETQSDAESSLCKDMIYANVFPGSGKWPNVEAIFPPHDPDFNFAWMQRWSSLSSVFVIPEGELTLLRNHFGSAIALYFDFLRYYFLHLALPATLGLVYFLSKPAYEPVYSFIILVWSLVLVEGWRLREKKLSIRWDTFNATARGRHRAGFIGDREAFDKASQRNVSHFPWWKRELRIIATSVPALLGFAAALGCIISTGFALEVILSEAYHGPGKAFLPLLPTIVFASLIPQVITLWQKNAVWLTKWENFESEDSHEYSMTIKMFAMNCLVSYGALTLTAYVYLPWGSIIVPKIISFIEQSSFSPAIAKGLSGEEFSSNPQRLVNTLFALMTTTQAVNAFMEITLPVIMRWITSKTSKKSQSPTGSKMTIDDLPEEKEYLDRLRKEVDLPEYSLFTEYGEMVTQFGYIVLWSVVWPLAPLAAFVNNFFELRSDAYKLSVNAKRPTPFLTDTIGPWLEAMSVITWLGVLTNSSLIRLYRSVNTGRVIVGNGEAMEASSLFSISETLNSTNICQPLPQKFVNYSSLMNVIAESTSPLEMAHNTSDPYKSIRSLLFSALLVTLASEHGYFLARMVIRHLLERLIWKSSDEEGHLRGNQIKMKVNYVDAVKSPSTTKSENPEENVLDDEASRENFWIRNDPGAEEIERLSKIE